MHHLLLLVAILLVASLPIAAGEPPWPAPVPGHQPLQAGEHPRLFFRKAELAALRARAATPEGQAVLKRLRVLLNGGDGESMPTAMRKPDPPYGDDSTPIEQPIGALTLSHPAGFGFLYQITGERKYADLGRQCMQLILDGYRDRDGKARYSFRKPTGALRAGPSLGLVALGYDLCYDGWDPAFRKQVAAAIENYSEGKNQTLTELVQGKRHMPASNHWGMQVGGGALAVLAITGDPEVANQKRVDGLLADSRKAMIRNVTEGFGEGGYFAEGDGCGSMASHIIYLPALQAWRISQGLDFVSPRPNARWTALKWLLLTIPRADSLGNLRACFPERGGYPHNIWARADGLSGAGYFSIGYSAVLSGERPAFWWFYNTHLKAHDDKAGTPWDTCSPYPHHAILAFVNTPFGAPLVNPAEVMPRNVRDARHGFYAFRNRWQDENDIVISQLTRKSPDRFEHGPDRAMVIWHHGRREEWGSIPAKADVWEPAADGSAIIGGGGTWVGIDFSGASGAPGLLVMVGGSPGGQTVTAGATTVALKVLGSGAPAPKAEGDEVVVGGQRIRFRDGRLSFATWAGPWKEPAAAGPGARK